MIDVKKVSKSFNSDNGNIEAVREVSFHVNRGEIYGIIGLSGAGKSTLVRLLNMLEKPTEGEILIDGVEMNGLSKKELLEKRKEIGMIFQHFNLFSQKTVRENIAYPLKIDKVDKKEIDERVNKLLEFIDLKDRADSYPAQLSGGQQQRVAIARAIARRPKVLLSDEGTSALDPKNTKQVLDLLRKISSELDTTIIMITHQMEVAKSICDRIAVMEQGRIVEENETQEIFLHPKHNVTRSFISKSHKSGNWEDYKTIAHKGRLIKLNYPGDTADKPIIADLIKKHDISLSILAGNIDTLNVGHLGSLLLEIIGKEEDVDDAVEDLLKQGVEVEVL